MVRLMDGLIRLLAAILLAGAIAAGVRLAAALDRVESDCRRTLDAFSESARRMTDETVGAIREAQRSWEGLTHAAGRAFDEAETLVQEVRPALQPLQAAVEDAQRAAAVISADPSVVVSGYPPVSSEPGDRLRLIERGRIIIERSDP